MTVKPVPGIFLVVVFIVTITRHFKVSELKTKNTLSPRSYTHAILPEYKDWIREMKNFKLILFAVR